MSNTGGASAKGNKGILEIVIDVIGARKAIGELNSLTKDSAKGVGIAAAKFQLLQSSVMAFAGSLQAAYSKLIESNETLNKQIIKTQTALSSNFRVFDAYGNEITGVADKITSLTGTVSNAIKQLEVETADLSGLTSSQVIDGFNTVLIEGGRQLQNQTKMFESDIEGQIKLTKGLLAGLTVESLGVDRAALELSTILNGDLNNPAANLARKLNLSKAEIESARASGELIDFLVGKFEAYGESQKLLAKGTIGGVTSNLKDFVEISTREAGAVIYDRIVDSLGQLEGFLSKIKPDIVELSRAVGDDLGQAIEFVLSTGKLIITLLGPVFKGSLDGALDLLDLTTDGLETIAKAFTELDNALSDPQWMTEWQERIAGLLEAIPGLNEETAKAIAGLNEAGEPREGFSAIDDIKQGLVNALTPLSTIVDGLKEADYYMALLNGDARDSQKALDTSAKSVGDLANEAERYAKLLADAKESGDEAKEALAQGLLTSNLEEQYRLQQEIEDIKAVGTDNSPKQLQQQEALIAKLQEQIDKTQALGVAAGDVKLEAQPLVAYGEAVDEFQTRLGNSLRSVAQEGNGVIDTFKASVQEAQSLVDTLYTIGEIDSTTAIEKLRAVLEEQALEPQERLAIEQQITKIVATESQRRQQIYSAELASVEADLAEGILSSADAAVQSAQIRAEQKQNELDGLVAKLAELEVTGTDQAEIQATSTSIEQLSAEVRKLGAESKQIGLSEELKKVGQQAQLAEAQIARTVAEAKNAIQSGSNGIAQTEGELDQQLLQQEQAANAGRQSILRDRISATQTALQSAVGEQKRELELELVQLETQLAESVSTAANTASQLIDAQAQAIRQSADLLRAEFDDSASQQAVAQQRQVTLFGEYESEKQLIAQKAATERAENEFALAQDSLAKLQALPEPQTQAERLKREAELRQATATRYTAELDYLKQVEALDNQARQSTIAALDRQQAAVANAANIGKLEAETRAEALRQGLQTAESLIATDQAKAAKDRSAVSVAQAKERFDQLTKLSAESEGNAKALEQDLQSAQEARYSAELDYLKSVGQLEATVRNRSRVLIEQQLQLLQQQGDSQAKQVQLATRGTQLQIEGLSRQSSLANALVSLEQAGLSAQKSSLSIRQAELASAQGLKSALEQSGRFEERVIRNRLVALGLLNKNDVQIAKQQEQNTIKQIALDEKALNARLRAEQNALDLKQKQLELQLQIAQAEAEQAVVREQQIARQLELELKKAELIEDPEVRNATIANLQEQLALQGKSISLAEKALTANAESASVQQQVAQAEREQFAITSGQQKAEFKAQAEQRRFEAERNTAKAKDQQFGGDKSQVGGGAGAGAGAEALARRTAKGQRGIGGSVTNNFNAPLMSGGVARALGI